MFDNVKRQIQTRLSIAREQCDQMNTIFAYIRLILPSFPGFDDDHQNRRLRAMVNVANLIGPIPDSIFFDEPKVIQAASEEIALRRLPRLLCIALVSVVETALKDFSIIVLRDQHADWRPHQVRKRLNKLFYGGPEDYLPKLASEFQFAYFLDEDWDDIRELTATRNILVHKSDLIAHDRYVRQAGAKARAKLGEALEVDDAYFTASWCHSSACISNMLSLIAGCGSKVF
ncbi:MAG: hypothetical protein U1A27_05580 [Phycisphaerae bacterium]